MAPWHGTSRSTCHDHGAGVRRISPRSRKASWTAFYAPMLTIDRFKARMAPVARLARGLYKPLAPLFVRGIWVRLRALTFFFCRTVGRHASPRMGCLLLGIFHLADFLVWCTVFAGYRVPPCFDRQRRGHGVRSASNLMLMAPPASNDERESTNPRHAMAIATTNRRPWRNSNSRPPNLKSAARRI